MASALASLLRRLAAVALVLLLCVGFISPAEAKGKAAKTISPEDMAVIRRQAEEFMEAKDRLPELATLVNERDWVFTRNLIRGPMQPLGREMLYINQRLLPQDRKEADKRAAELKTALAELDEAARLQDGSRLTKEYSRVASGFGAYAEMIPAEALS
ncbi:photosystem II protein PsbQ [Synechococcus sp. Minos11]|uniref:photosystem II protein PsbQ n=1 Tax=Synechococcus sp. Minos11 TaxID=221341 RepID=UPI00210420F4|nr:photosystem II protein PsbQ [Synechococcus sp. Minos11]|tara:strand:- start:428 stop:898 length:471 start_codon:yes stop_codon:yes gene_type:complete